MDRFELKRLFERVLAEPDSAEDKAALAARTAFSASLPLPPAEIYELEAAQSFLDRVSDQDSRVPSGLVEAVTADCVREARESAVAVRRVWKFSSWRAHWEWAAGAMAVVLLAVVAGIRINGKPVAPGASIAPPTAVATLQAPDGSNVAHVVPPPPPPKPAEKSGVLIDGSAFNAVAPPPPPPKPPAPKGRAVKTPEPVYTAPNPPIAITSHAVTVDDYPPASIRLQEQGTVKVKYLIQTDGNVSDCEVLETSGFPRLDEAACLIAKRWRFKPASLLDGTPVALRTNASIAFQLK
jgi:protein TonB